MLLLEYMDIHPHLPSEAKATTTTTGGYTQGDSQGLFPSLQDALRVPWPSLQGRGYISSLHNTQDRMPCHAQHATHRPSPPPQHTMEDGSWGKGLPVVKRCLVGWSGGSSCPQGQQVRGLVRPGPGGGTGPG